MKRPIYKTDNRDFYYPLPGLQSAKPNASVSRKLAIAISITASTG